MLHYVARQFAHVLARSSPFSNFTLSCPISKPNWLIVCQNAMCDLSKHRCHCHVSANVDSILTLNNKHTLKLKPSLVIELSLLPRPKYGTIYPFLSDTHHH